MNSVTISGVVSLQPTKISINNKEYFQINILNQGKTFVVLAKNKPSVKQNDFVCVYGHLACFKNSQNKNSAFIKTEKIVPTSKNINIINIDANVQFCSNVCGSINLIRLSVNLKNKQHIIYCDSNNFNVKRANAKIIGELLPICLDDFGFMEYSIIAKQIIQTASEKERE